jgi:hypothetical protein
VALRAELGVSSHDREATSYSLIRAGLMAGAGIRWQTFRWLELGIEADAGYQALVQTGQEGSGYYDPSAAKLGSQLIAAIRPWPGLPRAALLVRFGLFGHFLTQIDPDGTPRQRVFALPEGAVGISYGF